MKIDADAQAARFSRRIVIYEQPEIAEHLEEIAHTVGISKAAVVRSAVRDFLRRVDPPSARRAR